jgi:hypothetical protein
MGIRLEVRTQERKWVNSPEGFRSTDEKKADLMDFCSRHKIPYPCLEEYDFVSVWAVPANWSQTKQLGGGRSTWIPRNADSYGKEIIVLGDHVVDSLAYVACGDFQNTIMEAAKLERTGKDVRSYLDKMLFMFTPTMLRAERIAKLENASAEARRQIKLGDAEARLLRRLSNSDLPPTKDPAVE